MVAEIIPVEEKALTKITNYMESPVVLARFAKIMGERGASTYVSSALIAVADSQSLQKCSPVSIYTASLRAATLRLSVDPGVGQAYLVPFKGRATLVVGYKGLHDMAVRTGKYRYINAAPIYEGEEVTEDRFTGFHKIEGHKESNKVIGWISAFEMYGGYGKTLYMTVEEIHAHAKQYSSSYSYKDSTWQTEAPKMEKKTVLRLLLRRWGYMDPADVQVLDQIDEEQPETIDAEFGAIAQNLDRREAPEIHNSPAANAAVLMGTENPDPVKDATWSDWETWKGRAEKVKVLVSDVKRAGTTDGDLRAYIIEIAPFVRDAEEQA